MDGPCDRQGGGLKVDSGQLIQEWFKAPLLMRVKDFLPNNPGKILSYM